MAVYGIGENKCLTEVAEKTETYTKGDFIYVDKLFQIAANTFGTYKLTADDLGVDTVNCIMPVSHMISSSGESYRPVVESDTTTTYMNRIRIDTDNDVVTISYGHGNTSRNYVYVKVVLMKVK